MKNVKTDFAAVGDGATDDTVAIQNALNACSSGGAFAGVQLLFPAGTYKITASLVLTYSNYNLVGEGPQASVVSYYGALNTLSNGLLQTPTDATARGNMSFTGLRFTSNTPGGATWGLLATGSGALSGFKFNNCKFDNIFNAGIRAANPMDSCVFDGCEFTAINLAAYTGSNPVYGCINGTFRNTSVRDCYFHDTGQVSNLNHTIYMSGGCVNVSIINNQFINCLTDCCAFGTTTDGFGGNPQNVGLTFANNIIQATPLQGNYCVFVNNATGVSITGNTSVNMAMAAIVYPCLGWNISNNNVTFNGTLAQAAFGSIPFIASIAYGASNGVISNNTAAYTSGYSASYTGNASGIVLSGATDVEIFGNSISGFNLGIFVAQNNGPGYTCSRIHIHDNNIALYDGAIDNTGNHSYFGVFQGILVNGVSQDIYIENNHIRNYPYAITISNSSAVGPVAPAYTTANVAILHNRLYNCAKALWFHPTCTVVNVAFDNNFGASDIQTDGLVRNFRRVNNAVDGSYWSSPGPSGTQTNL